MNEMVKCYDTLLNLNRNNRFLLFSKFKIIDKEILNAAASFMLTNKSAATSTWHWSDINNQ